MFFLSAAILVTGFFFGIVDILPPSFIFLRLLSIAIFVVAFFVSILHIVRLHIRRLHDLGKAGNLLILYVIPVINLMFLLWLLFALGIYGSNKYGNEVAKDEKFFDVIFGRKLKPQSIGNHDIQ